MLDYELLWAVIFFEIGVVFFIVLIAFIYKYYYSHKSMRLKLLSNEICDYLNKIIQGKASFSVESFKKDWRRMEILLPILNEYNNKEKPEVWLPIRKELVDAILLPIARKGATDKYWITRMLSAQAFQFDTDTDDTEYILKLLNDEIPLIHLHAAMAAISDGSKKGIHRLIEIMAEYAHYSHSMYLQLFQEQYAYVPGYVREILDESKNPHVRWVCYEVLLKYPPFKDLSYIEQDIEAEDQELQINAIKYYKHAQGEKAIPKLLELLANQKWNARVICLHCLGSLKAKSAIPEIEKCLRDHVWWVRTAAAQALLQMGEEGIAVLNGQDPAVDRYAYDAAMHALNKPPTLEKG